MLARLLTRRRRRRVADLDRRLMELASDRAKAQMAGADDVVVLIDGVIASVTRVRIASATGRVIDLDKETAAVRAAREQLSAREGEHRGEPA